MSDQPFAEPDLDTQVGREQPPASENRRARPSHRPRARRKARMLALETLYETDLARHHPGEILKRRSAELTPDEDWTDYARELLAGVLEHRRELDDIIRARASAFPVEQMAAIDRNILRLGLYESVYRRDTVPLRAAISEAVELA